jgi:hypothetical protein
MKKYAFAALVAALALGACQPTPPPPPPPPPPIDITGVVVDMAGACHGIRGDNGTAYAVRPGVLNPPIRLGTRVHVVGVVDPAQDCPGRTLIRADGGVTMLAPPPRMRRVRGTTVPK